MIARTYCYLTSRLLSDSIDNALTFAYLSLAVMISSKCAKFCPSLSKGSCLYQMLDKITTVVAHRGPKFIILIVVAVLIVPISRSVVHDELSHHLAIRSKSFSLKTTSMTEKNLIIVGYFLLEKLICILELSPIIHCQFRNAR